MSELGEIIGRSHRIVFFGGAGVSTESGIPDFRSADGLYTNAGRGQNERVHYAETKESVEARSAEHSRESGTTYPPEEVLSHSFFVAYPEEFFTYYKTNLIHPEARPNTAHLVLAQWERQGILTSVVTQNIDGLHQMAGSVNVRELHGSVHRNYCMNCGKRYGLDVVLSADPIPYCECGGIIRPDVVLYEESLDEAVMEQSIREISRADTLIVGGTSLAVYPAAGLLQFFAGANLVLINKDPTPADRKATLVIHGPIGATFAEFLPVSS